MLGLQPLRGAITVAVSIIPELELSGTDLSFSFPYDPSVKSDRIPVIIFVDLFFKKRKRTQRVKQRLADEIATRFKRLPGNKNRMIEVRTNTFNPKREGYARIDP